MSDGDQLSSFVPGARSAAVAEPRSRYVDVGRPDAGTGTGPAVGATTRDPRGFEMPGGTRLPGSDEELIGSPQRFLFDVATEVVLRMPTPSSGFSAPARGEDFDVAVAMVARAIGAGYTDAARREMDFGTWLRRVYGVPDHVRDREGFVEAVTVTLTGSLVPALLQSAATLDEQEIEARYTPDMEKDGVDSEDDESELTVEDLSDYVASLGPKAGAVVPGPFGRVLPVRARTR
jgi:hypothetical protein